MSVLPELIGSSRAIVAVREEVSRLLQRQAGGRSLPPILIQGETGTGKGLLAGAIHRAGPRRNGPFVAVNCAAIPDTLLEAELFGFERGAFTDARHAKAGLVQTAHRGTLFLDEIGLLPVPLQGKLLTVLEEKTVRRLGGIRSEPVDIAIFTATSDDLERAVRERRFTEALYHRLSVLTLRLPPLRERGEDILLLAEHFLARAAAGGETAPRELTPDARAALLSYAWPGNVRELSNRMERVTFLADSGVVTPDMLDLPEPSAAEVPEPVPPREARRLRERVGSVERESLVEALAATGGNVTRAAARLGIPPTTLRYRLRKYGLAVDPPPAVSRPELKEQVPRSASPLVGDVAPTFSSSPGLADQPQENVTEGAVSREPVAANAERRQLTVMSCGLAVASVVAEQLDPEDLHQAMSTVQTACTDIIHRFEGHVAQYLADGLLLYFGYPVAHEDDAQRAVRTGLGVLEEVRRLNVRLEREHGVRVAARVGIHTGIVVIGGMGGPNERRQLALGDAPQIAVQLQDLAEPDTVVIGLETHRLIEGYFDSDALGVRTLKRISRPVTLYRVLQESTAQSRLDAASSSGLAPLVGREQEIELLGERWQRATEGLGQVVLLSGEPGIGKSRLVHALKERIAREPHLRLEFRCSPYYQSSALYPVIDHLQRRLQLKREEPPKESIGKLELALSASGLPLEDAVPLFAALLSLPLPEGYRALSLAPQRRKERTFEILLAWLTKESEQQATLAVWEDLHWLDPSTQEFLGLLVDQVPMTRVLVLLTTRPGFGVPWLNRSHSTQIALSRLTRLQAQVLVQHLAGAKPLPGDVLHQLVSKTDGVPLFLEQMTKMVLDSGLLQETAGEYQLTAPLARLTIPSTLQDLLMARLDRLGTGRQVAQLGAILGKEFPYELIHAVSPVDEATLQRELGQLVNAELLYQRGLPPLARYSFKHALIQDAAYHSLLKSVRQQYHEQIAMVLDTRFADIRDTQPELLAHHYTEAGLTEKAIAYWQKAGQRAIERSANVEAIGHLTRGLELLRSLPDSAERITREVALQLALGPPLLMTRGPAAPEVEDAYVRAHELCLRVEDSPHLFPVLAGLWRSSLNRARYKVAHDLANRCLSIAQQMQDPSARQEAHAMLGSTLLFLGEFVSARDHLDQGIALLDPDQSRSLAFTRGTDPGVICLSRASWALWMLGYPDQARNTIEEALALARKSSHGFSLALALQHATVLHLWRGEVQLVQERGAETIALSREQGFVQFLAGGSMRLGWVLAQQGLPQQGILQLRQGLATWKAIGLKFGLPHLLAMLAEAHGKNGDAEQGLCVASEALAEVEHTGEHLYEAELYRLKGELLLQHALETSRPFATPARAEVTPPGLRADESVLHASAEACFRRAIDSARQRHAKSLELRAVMSLSRLWQRQHRLDQAHKMLDVVYQSFNEGLATADLRQAKAMLDEFERIQRLP